MAGTASGGAIIQHTDKSGLRYPYSGLPYLPALGQKQIEPAPPTDQECFALWQKYGMLPNIRFHSLRVAQITTALALAARDKGLPVCVQSCRAAGLLHDLGKTYSLEYGGSHAVLGACWVIEECHNYAIGQGVLLHVHWPWPLPRGQDICCLPIFVIYADKRVEHDRIVSLEERFDDLLRRYGKTRRARAGIRKTHKQAKTMERALSRQLGRDLNEDTFDSGRLVI